MASDDGEPGEVVKDATATQEVAAGQDTSADPGQHNGYESGSRDENNYQGPHDWRKRLKPVKAGADDSRKAGREGTPECPSPAPGRLVA